MNEGRHVVGPKKPFILTGAGGWFGRNALWEYERLFGPEALRTDVLACCSTKRLIEFGSPFGPIQAVSLEELENVQEASGLIHLAFLTQEHLDRFGLRSYVEINRSITSVITRFISRQPGMPIITTSSGAAASLDGAEPDLCGKPYATLKQEEEQLWRAFGKSQMAAVFRVYAATGRFIKKPRIFALGDFLSRAINGEQIEIKSTKPVFRSYVHAGSMMRLFWAILVSPRQFGFQQIDACVDTFGLEDLAILISQLWHLPPPISRIDASLVADRYQGNEKIFVSLLGKYRVNYLPFCDQLQETAVYLSGISDNF
jgi:nucleoside-diphosphate-sugar epimerase